MFNNKRKNDFIRGLKTNSIIIIIISVLLFVSIIYFTESFIDNGGILKTPSLFLFKSKDNYGLLSYYVYDDKEKGTELNRIYYFGGSSAYYMLDYNRFRYNIETQLNGEYLFVPLAAQMETTSETLLMIENLPDGNSIVILNTYYKKATDMVGNPKFYLKTDNEGYDINGRRILSKEKYSYTSNLLFRRILDRAFLSESISRMFAKPKIKDIEEFDIVIPVDYKLEQKDFDKRINVQREVLLDDSVYTYIDEYQRLLNDIAVTCNEKGYTLIILDGTLNYEAIGEEYLFADNSLYFEYDRLLDEVATKNDNTYRCENIVSDYYYQDELFRDGIHIGDPDAIYDLTDKLTTEVKEIIENAS